MSTNISQPLDDMYVDDVLYEEQTEWQGWSEDQKSHIKQEINHLNDKAELLKKNDWVRTYRQEGHEKETQK